MQWKNVIEHLGLTNRNLPRIMKGNASSDYWKTQEQHSIHQISGIQWLPTRNHRLYMAHIIYLAFGAFTRSLGVSAAPCREKPMSEISDLESMKTQSLGRVKD